MNPLIRVYLLGLIVATLASCASDASFVCRFCTPHPVEGAWWDHVRRDF